MSQHSLDVAGGFRIFWREEDPERITLATENPIFADAPGVTPPRGPGLKIVFSSNDDHRDFHPVYFNRCRRALLANGKLAPPEATETSRRL